MGRGVAVACGDYKLGVKKCRSSYERGKRRQRHNYSSLYSVAAASAEMEVETPE